MCITKRPQMLRDQNDKRDDGCGAAIEKRLGEAESEKPFLKRVGNIKTHDHDYCKNYSPRAYHL